MKAPDLAKWEHKKELERLLVFAQALEEMLFNYTIDLYKAPALNPSSNVFELRYLASGILENKVKWSSIEHAIEELVNKFRNDPIIGPKYDAVFSSYIDRIRKVQKGQKDARGLVSLTNSIIGELDGFYWVRLLEKIRATVVDELENIPELIALASAFITEAELRGYSRNYVYYRTRKYFFESDASHKTIKAANQIDDFFGEFEAKPSDWQVVFRGSSSFESVRKFAADSGELGIKLEIVDGIPSDVPKDFRGDNLFSVQSDLPLYISVHLSSKLEIIEPVSARERARQSVDTLADLNAFANHKEQMKTHESAVVINHSKSKEATILKPMANPMECGLQRVSEEARELKMMRFLHLANGGQFEPRSTYLFRKALDFHRAALKAGTLENQLLDLWALLEGFLPSPPSEDLARITHYLDNLIPALTLTYAEKIFRYIMDSIKDSGDELEGVISGLSAGGDFFEQTVALMVCSDLSDGLGVLCKKLDRNPLLRYRIVQASAWFNSKSNTKNTIEAHISRVHWHIRRIYMTRNYIIHNAESLPYLRTLVENLHSYVDLLIESVGRIAEMSVRSQSIPAVLDVMSAHRKAYMNDLGGDDAKCTTQNYKDIIFGGNNPLNPFRMALTLSSGMTEIGK